MISDDLKSRWYKPDQYDNDSVFLERISRNLTPQSRVLDAGAGAGDLFPYDFKNRVQEMVGVDLDPRVTSNPRLHRGILSDLTSIPIEDNYFDVIFSRAVLEHVQEPERFLNEMGRLLKPGGVFVFLTPNRWHYVCVGSQLTPHGFHEWYNKRLRGREDEDTFPTVYRLNSASSVRRHFGQAGFVEKELLFRECCPNYLLFAAPAFYLGVLYERLVNSTDFLAGLRVNILGTFAKPGR